MAVSIVIAAGGTAGHLVPGFAVAEALRRRSPGARVSFVGTPRGLERELVPAHGYAVHTTDVRPFSRDPRGIAAGFSVLPAVAQARRILRAVGASAVLGMGGYPSVPVVAAARALGIPAVIHEANAIPGLANQLAARFTANVAVTYAATLRGFGRRAPRLTGMPLRAEIAGLDRLALRADAERAFELDPSRATVLAFGGSLGAARVNAAVAGVARLWRDRDDVQILWAAGRAHADEARAHVPAGRLVVRALGYIERMDLAYAAADVVVSRAGSSSVSEIAAAGLPAILVPYPHARRHEQDANAVALVEPDAALVIPDAGLTAETLAVELDGLLRDPERRAAMGKAARSIARLDAADTLASWVLELAGA
jgi:UDP-N-acetylglucosamine--N-acetylmuramyl-(pentapeptide) pyrophosphoryl-undecaprenol N-acetylglucosamine transferase